MTNTLKFLRIALRLGVATLASAFLYSATASAAPTATGNGTQLIMLGTNGGPVIAKARSEPSTLLVVDGTTYLIDCGVGAVRRIVEAGFEPQTIRTIFITHHHPDHDLGLASIMASDFFSIGGSKTKGAWNIYGPPGTNKFVDAAVAYLKVPFDTFAAEKLAGTDIKSHFTAHDIAGDGLVYQDDKIRVTAMENAHYSLMTAKQRKHFKSYSYRIETPHGVIVFTGDTGPSEAVAKFAKGADLLVSEVIDLETVLKGRGTSASTGQWSADRRAALEKHLTREHLIPSAVAHIAKEAQVRSVLLHHFVPSSDSEQAAKDVAGVKAGYAGQVIASHDLARYCVDASASDGHVLSTCP